MDERSRTVALRENHVIDIYDESADLDRRLAGYVASGLRADEAVIVIASRARLSALAGLLAAEGVEVDRCRSEHLLIESDAEALYRGLFSDGSLDLDSFLTMAEEMAGLAEGRPGVRVAGELVDLLWSDANVLGALALEEAWAAFARARGFELYCCYCADNLLGSEHELAELQRIHDDVVAAPEHFAWLGCRAIRAFPGAVGSPRAARRFAGEVLESWDLGEEMDSAGLIVSELGTNAILHADSAFEVALTRSKEGLRIAVTDSSPTVPVAPRPNASSATGRGLGIVASLARQWGVETGPGGKTVWVELAVTTR